MKTLGKKEAPLKNVFTFLCAVLLVGCSGGGSAGSDGNDAKSGTIFGDSQVPICDRSKNYKLQGKLMGQDIAVAESQFNNLQAKELYIVEAVNDMARTDLSLVWSEPLAADKVISLTGTSVRVPDDQPLAGQSFCVTDGDLGAATPSDPSNGRTVVFRLTGLRQGDCSGMPVAAELRGCVWRSATAGFPGQ